VQKEQQRAALAALPGTKIHALNCNLSGVTGQIFISHDPAEAAAYVEGLGRHLTASGLMTVYEREIGGDQRWAQAVEQIRECAAMVVVMTPGAERSPWVNSEVTFAKDLGKPILPLLLGGTGFAGLAQLPSENVTTGAMPSAAFITRLRSFVPPIQLGQPTQLGQPSLTEGSLAPAGVAMPPSPAPPPVRNGLIIGIVAAAVVGALVLVCVGGALIVRSQTAASRTPQTWQERAAAIPGIHNYLISNPEWFQIGPQGNHRRGLIDYPISPPVGGLHNPFWQNCMGDVYDDEIPREQAMHSLEHGAVWVTYRPDLSKSDITKLASKVNGVPYLFMSPYPGLDAPISLQAWGYQLKVSSAGDGRIDQFIQALRLNATQEPGATCSGGITETGLVPLDPT
jgi:hypothetical protein